MRSFVRELIYELSCLYDQSKYFRWFYKFWIIILCKFFGFDCFGVYEKTN